MSDNDRKTYSKTYAFLIAVGVAGAFLTAVAAAIDDRVHPFFFSVSAAGGGSLVGAAVSLILSKVFEPPQVDEIRSMLDGAKTQIAKFLADSIDENRRMLSSIASIPLLANDDQVCKYRKLYHGYLWSHADEQEVWKYRIFDFNASRVPGHLHATVPIWVVHGGTEIFHYDGFRCDEHLVLIGRPDDPREPWVVQIFPCGCRVQDGSPLAGLAFFTTSDNKPVVSPTLLSPTLLARRTELGPVDPSESAAIMALWRKHFDKFITINFKV